MATGARKLVLRTLGILGVGGAGLVYSLEQSVKADIELHPPKFKWSHNGPFSSLDHASVRRGYEVYKNVCAACHSLKYVCYRDLVGASHTEAEAKAEAAEIMVTDGPNEEGNMFQRSGKIGDKLPSPYPNEEAARFANNGALPPDLSYMTLARHGGEDYIFALLTGYCDPPAGITMREGLYYNPYFAGGSIGMAQAIYNETIEYTDGTPATASQLAKDVCTFLVWASDPHYDERKRLHVKVIALGVVFNLLFFYYYKFKWSSLFTRKVLFKPPKK